MKIDLNSDLGESFGAWTMGDDPAMLDIVTSANVACGFHAGDPLVMHKTMEAAKARGVSVGAHPGFLDLWGFGRRTIMGEKPSDIEKHVTYQIGAAMAMAASVGIKLAHIKTHGMLGNLSMEDADLAAAVARAVRNVDRDLILVVWPQLELEKAGLAAGLRVVREIYADRTYEENGALTHRSKPGAVITDPKAATARILRSIEDQSIIASSGKQIPVQFDTICVHGDNPHAVAMAASLRDGIVAAGHELVPFPQILNG